MQPMKTILRRGLSLLLAAAVLLPGAMPAYAFAADTQSAAVQSVLAGKQAPYDLLIYFKSAEGSSLTLKQKADAAREALLQKQSRREYLETQAQLARALTRLRVKHHSENLD